MDLKKHIKDKAKDQAIDICRITDSLAFDYLREYLLERIAKNINTEFEEEDIDKRINPRLTLPTCKSIIVVGLSYNVDYKEKVNFPYKGKLSMSSWGLDYHRVLKKKIENLVEEIKAVKDFEYKYFVDTGPLIDRELAVKSGLGYYGKNCSVINDTYGSFIFLGYILTDLDLSPDEIVENKCGDCRLCLDACPTGALEGPCLLNAKKCISYLTQSKGEIPRELIKKMGIKIYGCDTCQLVCPKNRGVVKSKEEDFIPNITKGYVDLKELMRMSKKEFKEKYGSMAGSWRGKNILIRNGKNILENIYLIDLEIE